MWSIILSFMAGVANALMDLSSENRFNKKSLNKGESSENKWKQPREPGNKPWYYFGVVKLRFKESFPYSSTMLVLLTDFWHLMQSFMLTFLFAAIVLYVPIISFDFVLLEILANFIILRVSYGVGFEPLYKNLKLKLLKDRKL